jgi:hypothetical protein
MLGGTAVDDKGQIYLSFMMPHKVAIYTEDGKMVRPWGRRGAARATGSSTRSFLTMWFFAYNTIDPISRARAC